MPSQASVARIELFKALKRAVEASNQSAPTPPKNQALKKLLTAANSPFFQLLKLAWETHLWPSSFNFLSNEYTAVYKRWGHIGWLLAHSEYDFNIEALDQLTELRLADIEHLCYQKCHITAEEKWVQLLAHIFSDRNRLSHLRIKADFGFFKKNSADHQLFRINMIKLAITISGRVLLENLYFLLSYSSLWQEVAKDSLIDSFFKMTWHIRRYWVIYIIQSHQFTDEYFEASADFMLALKKLDEQIVKAKADGALPIDSTAYEDALKKLVHLSRGGHRNESIGPSVLSVALTFSGLIILGVGAICFVLIMLNPLNFTLLTMISLFAAALVCIFIGVGIGTLGKAIYKADLKQPHQREKKMLTDFKKAIEITKHQFFKQNKSKEESADNRVLSQTKINA